jgi:hypothetical protein
MVSVKGTFRNGRAVPEEVVDGRDGQPVIITFVEDGTEAPAADIVETNWDGLIQWLEECKIDTGIPDLAHQHEHYLYGTPKQPDPDA